MYLHLNLKHFQTDLKGTNDPGDSSLPQALQEHPNPGKVHERLPDDANSPNIDRFDSSLANRLDVRLYQTARQNSDAWLSHLPPNHGRRAACEWVNAASAKVLKLHVRQGVQFGGKRSLVTREIKACSVLKIKFGSNFIDNGTPLVIQDFCMNQTLNLLLISAGRQRGRDGGGMLSKV